MKRDVVVKFHVFYDVFLESFFELRVMQSCSCGGNDDVDNSFSKRDFLRLVWCIGVVFDAVKVVQ